MEIEAKVGIKINAIDFTEICTLPSYRTPLFLNL